MSIADDILAKIRADIGQPIKRNRAKPEKLTPSFEVLPDEQWKPSQEYPGYYVSDHGRIASELRGQRKLLRQYRIIREGGQPHHKVCLIKNGTKHTVAVHNLVAQEFLANDDPAKTKVSHIDGDNDNNHVSNLEWVTSSESRIRAFKIFPRKDVKLYKGETLRQHSLKLGGNRALVSNRIQKTGWCIDCACTIPLNSKETCLHVEK